MPNMSYCRFQNTLRDLQDCFEHLDDIIEDEEELKAQEKLIKLCLDTEDYLEEETIERFNLNEWIEARNQ